MPPSGRSSRERSDRADPARAGGGARRAARRADARGRAAAVLALGLPARPPGAARARAATGTSPPGSSPDGGGCSRAARSARSRRCASTSPRRAARRCSTRTEKQGRSGRLTFTTVGQQVFQRDELVVDERQTIVYRDMPGEPVAPATPCEPRAGRRGRVVDRDHPAAAVPLLRADLQRPPHPLRPRLRARRRGLPRAGHPRPAAGAGDGRGRPCARSGHGVRVPARRPAVRAPGPRRPRTDGRQASVHDRSGRQTAQATIS